MRIPRVQSIPQPVIRQIPRPVVDSLPPPTTRGIKPPVINVPNPTIEYPEIDVPTREEWEGQISPPKEKDEVVDEEKTRELPTTPAPISPQAPKPNVVEEIPPSVNIGGYDVPLPEVAPLVAAGATAIVATGVSIGATVVFTQLKTVAEPMISSALKGLTNKNKKVKLKKEVKPVLHFCKVVDGVQVFQYSAEGTKLLSTITDPEKYLRDNVELDGLYEYDNKLIIDDSVKDMFTKEGQKRFKRHFCPAKAIVKKLSAKFSV